MIDTSRLNEGDTVTLMPVGLDQQGRYQTRPMPAECCTSVGVEDYSDDTPRDWTVVGAVAAIALTLVWALFLAWVVART